MSTITIRANRIENTIVGDKVKHICGSLSLAAGDILDFPDAVFANVSCVGTIIGSSVTGDYGLPFGWSKGDAVGASTVKPITGAVNMYYAGAASTEYNVAWGGAADVLSIADGASTNLKLKNRNAANAIFLVYDIKLFG